MLSYSLIVIIVIGITVGVYAYLQLAAPKERFECTPDISLVLRDAGCSILTPNEKCNIRTTTVDFSAILENKGHHKLSGAYLRLGAKENEVKELINEKKLFFNQGLQVGNIQTGVQPGSSVTFSTRYENPVAITEGTLDLEIQPFVGVPEKLLVCDAAVITQQVTCSKGNVLPIVTITQPASQTFILGAPGAIPFTISASDCDGEISKVELWERATTQAEGNENSYNISGTYKYGLYTAGKDAGRVYGAGSYLYTAVAYDDKAGRAFSQPITLTFKENLPPSIIFRIFKQSGEEISPGSVITSADQVLLRAEVTDPDDTDMTVRFYLKFKDLGGALIELGEVAPKSPGIYEFQLSPRATGTHYFMAQAADNHGGSAFAPEASIQVRQESLAPGLPVTLEVSILHLKKGQISDPGNGGTGTVTVKKDGQIIIDKCESKCAAQLKVDDVILLEAIAASGSEFVSWGGGVSCLKSIISPDKKKATCEWKLTNDQIIGAAFNKP